jgi:hypothetical protein
MLSMILTIDFD